MLWFTKGDDYEFNLDAVRVAQKYPGKLHAKGQAKGMPSGNPLGKNPGDVWDIPNVKSNHVEKTEHPCQFPVGLVHRLVRALSKPGDLVLDPFAGVASTGVAALLEKRRFVGAEPVSQYVTQAVKRLRGTINGTTAFRPAEQDIHIPRLTDKVAQRPASFDRVVVQGTSKTTPQRARATLK
ncbi:DNA adenine methyltransferase YhdJ [compost metagenome]